MTCTIQRKLHFNQENISFFNILLSRKKLLTTNETKIHHNSPRTKKSQKRDDYFLCYAEGLDAALIIYI